MTFQGNRCRRPPRCAMLRHNVKQTPDIKDDLFYRHRRAWRLLIVQQHSSRHSTSVRSKNDTVEPHDQKQSRQRLLHPPPPPNLKQSQFTTNPEYLLTLTTVHVGRHRCITVEQQTNTTNGSIESKRCLVPRCLSMPAQATKRGRKTDHALAPAQRPVFNRCRGPQGSQRRASCAASRFHER